MLNVAYSENPEPTKYGDSVIFGILIYMVIAFLYSSIFAIITFGPKAVRYFTLVFTPAAIPIYLLSVKLEALSSLIARITQIHPWFVVTYLSVMALSGISIALFNRRVIKEPTLL